MAGSLGPLIGMGSRGVTVSEMATITDFDQVSCTYTIYWHGTWISYVYSLGDVRHDVGESVSVVVEGGMVRGIVP